MHGGMAAPLRASGCKALGLAGAAALKTLHLPAPCRSAPELLMGQKCSCKADVYSLGVVLW